MLQPAPALCIRGQWLAFQSEMMNSKTDPMQSWTFSVADIQKLQWPDDLAGQESSDFALSVRRGKVNSEIVPEGDGAAKYVSAEDFAKWLDANNVKPSPRSLEWLQKRHVPWPQNAESSSAVIPEDGWLFHSRFGYQATASGLCLVRLEELVHFVAKEWNKPLHRATFIALDPFVKDDGVLGDKWLYVLDAHGGYAQKLIATDGRAPRDIKGLDKLPGLDDYTGGHRAKAKDVVRATGEYWIEHGLPKGDAVTFDRRLAIPIENAHELWGWGQVAEPVQQSLPESIAVSASIAPMPRIHAVEAPKAPTEYERLIAYRKDNPADWPADHQRIIHDRYMAGKNGTESRITHLAMGESLGVEKQRIGQIIKEYKTTNRQQDTASKATFWPGLGR